MTRHTHLYFFVTLLLILWTTLVSFEIYRDISAIKQTTVTLARKEAVTTFNKDLSLRLWATEHGGVYVPVSTKTQPNKYLAHLPERDITTPSGRELTLMNPAYMMRQVMADFEKLYGPKGRIVSAKPLNPVNSPDPWQHNALEILANGKEKEVFEIFQGPEGKHLRFMRPIHVKEGCLKCHGHQDYKVGDLRGGVEVSIDLAPYLVAEKKAISHYVLSYVSFWFLGVLASLYFLIWGQKKITEENLVKEQLQKSLDEIKTLRGIIPICAYCKKIRDVKGTWEQLEKYIHQHSESEFSHGVCPECYKKEMEEID